MNYSDIIERYKTEREERHRAIVDFWLLYWDLRESKFNDDKKKK